MKELQKKEIKYFHKRSKSESYFTVVYELMDTCYQEGIDNFLRRYGALINSVPKDSNKTL
jgi:hypothetical protein